MDHFSNTGTYFTSYTHTFLIHTFFIQVIFKELDIHYIWTEVKEVQNVYNPTYFKVYKSLGETTCSAEKWLLWLTFHHMTLLGRWYWCLNVSAAFYCCSWSRGSFNCFIMFSAMVPNQSQDALCLLFMWNIKSFTSLSLKQLLKWNHGITQGSTIRCISERVTIQKGWEPPV